MLVINEAALEHTLNAHIYVGDVGKHTYMIHTSAKGLGDRHTFDSCPVFQCTIAFRVMSRLCCFANMFSIHALNALLQCKCPSRLKDPRAVPYKWNRD